MLARLMTTVKITSIAAGLLGAGLCVSAQQPNAAETAVQRFQRAQAELAAKAKEAEAKPTPRAADGHPDMTGFWSPPGGPETGFLNTETKVSADGKTFIYGDRDAPELDA